MVSIVSRYRKSWGRVIPALLGTLLLAVALAACGAGAAPAAPASSGSSSSQAAAESPAGGDLLSLSGDIAVDGSSTVFPITEAVAEEFGNLTDGPGADNRRGFRHWRRIQKVLQRRNGYCRRLPAHPGQRGQPLR